MPKILEIKQLMSIVNIRNKKPGLSSKRLAFQLFPKRLAVRLSKTVSTPQPTLKSL